MNIKIFKNTGKHSCCFLDKDNKWNDCELELKKTLVLLEVVQELDAGFAPFSLHYFDKNGLHRYLGKIEIYHQDVKSNNSDSDVISHVSKYINGGSSVKQLDIKFCSIMYGKNIYSELKKMCGEDDYLSTLKKLREISVIGKDELKKIDELDVFKLSLLKESQGIVNYDLTKLKFKINPTTTKDTYTFFSDIEKEFKNIYSGNLSKEFARVVHEIDDNISCSIDFFAMLDKYVDEYGKKLKKNRKKSHLEYMKKMFSDKLNFVLKINKILQTYQKIYDLNDKIADFLKVEEYDEQSRLELGQYTSIRTIENVICREDGEVDAKKADSKDDGKARGRLRLTNARQVNDPMEGRVLFDFLFSEPVDVDFVQSHIYISSATSQLDSLPMWKQYAKDAQGVVLQYSDEFIESIVKSKNVDLAKMCYLDIENGVLNHVIIEGKYRDDVKAELIELSKEIEKEIAKDETGDVKKDILDILRPLAFLFKHKNYSYEREYRIMHDNEIFKRDIKLFKKEGMPLPFLYVYLKDFKLKYKRVILGAKSIDVDYVAPYIKHCDNQIKIEVSKINYR